MGWKRHTTQHLLGFDRIQLRTVDGVSNAFGARRRGRNDVRKRGEGMMEPNRCNLVSRCGALDAGQGQRVV
jgi:hypothetical protein